MPGRPKIKIGTAQNTNIAYIGQALMNPRPEEFTIPDHFGLLAGRQPATDGGRRPLRTGENGNIGSTGRGASGVGNFTFHHIAVASV
jgi:hypothetical protein